MRYFFLGFGVLAALFVASIGVAAAHDHVVTSGDELREIVAGNTIETLVAEGAGDTAYYAENGTIKGDGYTGSWRVVDDQLCAIYGEDPERCWMMVLHGDEVTWLYEGQQDGAGIVVPGNPLGL